MKEHEYILKDNIESKDSLIDALFNNKRNVSKKLMDNKELLEKIEDACLRIEESSSYTNIKLDSKFNDHEMFLNKKFDLIFNKIEK